MAVCLPCSLQCVSIRVLQCKDSVNDPATGLKERSWLVPHGDTVHDGMIGSANDKVNDMTEGIGRRHDVWKTCRCISPKMQNCRSISCVGTCVLALEVLKPQPLVQLGTTEGNNGRTHQDNQAQPSGTSFRPSVFRPGKPQ